MVIAYIIGCTVSWIVGAWIILICNPPDAECCCGIFSPAWWGIPGKAINVVERILFLIVVLFPLLLVILAYLTSLYMVWHRKHCLVYIIKREFLK